jgi:hypothetical protein
MFVRRPSANVRPEAHETAAWFASCNDGTQVKEVGTVRQSLLMVALATGLLAAGQAAA